MFFIYYFLISFSIVGYGFVLANLLKINSSKFGFLGLLGITSLTVISYFSSIFVPHNFLFNFFILILGITFFLVLIIREKNIKKEFLTHLIIFTLLIIFILVSKNHDDFPYYHFPYSQLLTEYSHPIGLGSLNLGFRTPSSIFFLSSLFYLPKVDIFLMHLAPAFFLGFSNIILLDFIFSKEIYQKNKLINFLSLLIFLFINIFFYRLAEYGTDKPGQILVFILLIYLIILVFKNDHLIEKNNNYIKFFLIISCLLISIKPFYLIYSPMFLLLFLEKKLWKNLKIKNFYRTLFLCVSFIIIILLFNFINSGCIVYPAEATCFYNLEWSLTKKNIEEMRIWYELWAKAGATPNYVVENKLEFISDFNWFNIWIKEYFFNKVSDFILGLSLLSLIFYIIYFSKEKLSKNYKFNFRIYFIYLFLLIIFIEWFLYHPALRYGGYHLFALLFFIPISISLQKTSQSYSVYLTKAKILIAISIIIFVGRNISRLNNEYNKYNYNPFFDYRYEINDNNFYYRYSDTIKKNILNYKKTNFLGKNFLLIKNK